MPPTDGPVLKILRCLLLKQIFNIVYGNLFNHETLFFSELHENVRNQFHVDPYWEMLVHEGRLGEGGGRFEHQSKAF